MGLCYRLYFYRASCLIATVFVNSPFTETQLPERINSLHEPEVQCISKGKEHKKYEFGNKVSIIRSITGIILGAKSFRNEYDGHTIEDSLLQVERITGKKIRRQGLQRKERGWRHSNIDTGCSKSQRQLLYPQEET